MTHRPPTVGQFIIFSAYKDPDPNANPVGNGTFKISMKLTKEIPNFIPAAGKKIRVSYTGCQSLCTNCYRAHYRNQCRNQKTKWIEYVKRFKLNNETIEDEWYGRWWGILDKQYSNSSKTNRSESTLMTRSSDSITNISSLKSKHDSISTITQDLKSQTPNT